MEDREVLKQKAAEYAVRQVTRGMVLGIGSGSTVKHVVDALANRLREGSLTKIVCVPASEKSAAQARSLSIPVGSLDDYPILDVAIDGADEVAPDLSLIKGGGGALLREKIVASAARRLVIVVDDSKLVSRLGTKAPLPVEVIRFGAFTIIPHLEHLGARPVLRLGMDGRPFITDEGNIIFDCYFNGISDPVELQQNIRSRAGVVETGLFTGMTSQVIVASVNGIRELHAI